MNVTIAKLLEAYENGKMSRQPFRDGLPHDGQLAFKEMIRAFYQDKFFRLGREVEDLP